MKYTQKSFTALGSDSGTYTHAHAVCRESGHMASDLRGKCLRCGERPDPYAPRSDRPAEQWGRIINLTAD